ILRRRSGGRGRSTPGRGRITTCRSRSGNSGEGEGEGKRKREGEGSRLAPAPSGLSLRLHRKKSKARSARAFRCGPSSVRHRFGLPPSAVFEEAETMPNETTFLLHEKLIAWQVACDLLRVVRDARIADGKLRDQAMRAAQSACLNIAEANGRVAPADRRRVLAKARGEATEAAAAVQIAAMSGQCTE